MFEKLKDKIKDLEEIQGYVHYVYDLDKWETRIHPLPKIKPILEFRELHETYKLDKVAYYLSGKPVFLIIRGIPYSLEIEETDKVLKIKGYSADEIEAKINSVYVNTVFRKGSLQFKDYLVLILTNIITGFGSLYYFYPFNHIFKSRNTNGYKFNGRWLI